MGLWSQMRIAPDAGSQGGRLGRGRDSGFAANCPAVVGNLAIGIPNHDDEQQSIGQCGWKRRPYTKHDGGHLTFKHFAAVNPSENPLRSHCLESLISNFAMSPNVQSALRFSEKGPFNTVLKVASVPVPEFPSSHSLIQVRASAINLSDVGNVEGRFEATTLPRTPGRDFAGTVVKGPHETIGKNVWGTGGRNGVDRDGSHAEYLVIPSDCVEEMPTNLSFAQAAACGVAFLTAAAMVDKAKPTKGDFVLVLGRCG